MENKGRTLNAASLFHEMVGIIHQKAEQVNLQVGDEKYLVDDEMAKRSIQISLNQYEEGVLVYSFSFADDDDVSTDFSMMYIEDIRTDGQTAISVVVVTIGKTHFERPARLHEIAKDQRSILTESLKKIRSFDWKIAVFKEDK